MNLTKAITRGIIRNPGTRRWMMFILVLVAMLLLFFGATFLSNWLMERPALFLLYWITCAWLTMTAVLLAIFDMLSIRAEGRAAIRRLRSEVGEAEETDKDLKR